MTEPKQPEPGRGASTRRRIAEAAAAMERATALSDAGVAKILAERALALARPLEEAAPEDAALELVVFTLGPERYALETRHIREVARLSEITPLPLAPSPFVGVANLRGEVVPLVDLGQFLGLGAAAPTTPASALVLGRDAVEIGVLVSAVERTMELPVANLLETAGGAPDKAAGLRRGVTGDAMVVLDGDRLISDDRLVISVES